MRFFRYFWQCNALTIPESNRLADEAMSRLEIALRDAAVDAYTGKIRYADEMISRSAA
jgi:hypothetical protein